MNTDSDSEVLLNVFAHENNAQVALAPMMQFAAPWLHLMVDIEDMATIGRKLKRFLDGLPLGITSHNQALSNFIYQGPLHMAEKPLQLTVQLDGR